MKKSIIAIIGLLVIAGGAFAMGEIHEAGSWRYKITINIQTPDGIKSGSAVREISNSFTDIGPGLPNSTNTPKVEGEAVVIDLREKGKLFGLINWDSYREVSEVFPYKDAKGIADSIKYYKNLPIGKTAELTEQRYWPQLVRFEDLDDPMSVQAVEADNLVASYGGEYAIDSIVIEITDEDLDCDILKIIPKFDEEYWEWRKTLKFSDKRKISSANFCKGKVNE